MYNDIVWGQNVNEEMCIASSLNVADYAKRLAHGHWSFLGPGSEKKWCGAHIRTNRIENGIESRKTCCSTPANPYSVDPALWNEEIFQTKEKENCLYICGDDNTAELVLRTTISVNQLSIYGAAADMCDELAWRLSLVVHKVQGNVLFRTMQIPW